MSGPTLTDLRKVKECETVIGYTFQNPKLLWKALQPDESLCVVRPKDCHCREKHLAVLGAKVVDFLLAEKWFRGGGSTHAALTLMKENIERAMWAIAGGGEDRWQLWRFLTKQPEEGYLPAEMEEGVCYAITGAIFLDGGMEEARGFVGKFFIDLKDGYVWP
ncbi:MAG: hypothetical protein Q9218_003092 [Villophora microphyllina]